MMQQQASFALAGEVLILSLRSETQMMQQQASFAQAGEVLCQQ